MNFIHNNRSNTLDAIVIDIKDNVATVVRSLDKGRVINIKIGKMTKRLKLKDYIPCWHKVAIRRIPKNAAIVKYGYPVGYAIKEIMEGEHVHVHNVKGIK